MQMICADVTMKYFWHTSSEAYVGAQEHVLLSRFAQHELIHS
jgi:hypothetical protein